MSAPRGESFLGGLEHFAVIAALGYLVLKAFTGGKSKNPESKKQG